MASGQLARNLIPWGGNRFSIGERMSVLDQNEQVAEMKVMTVKEVAEYLRMKPVTIYKLANQGRIPAFKVASFWRFMKDLIDKWATEESEKTGQ